MSSISSRGIRDRINNWNYNDTSMLLVLATATLCVAVASCSVAERGYFCTSAKCADFEENESIRNGLNWAVVILSGVGAVAAIAARCIYFRGCCCSSPEVIVEQHPISSSEETDTLIKKR
ncbi:MAG: hypothetical protein K1060chlam4_00189 [Candidatus Anoxychlamydiales bacterium]|nr:hypothetical protein [Candidatus Anoxychlamydiales bacterium]